MIKLRDESGNINPEIHELARNIKDGAFGDAIESGGIEQDLARIKTEKIAKAQYNLWEEKMTTKLQEAKVDGVFQFAFPSEKSAQLFQDDAKYLADRINGRLSDNDITLSSDDDPETQAKKLRKIEGIAAISATLGITSGQEEPMNEADLIALTKQKNDHPDVYQALTARFMNNLKVLGVPLPENLLEKYGPPAQANFYRKVRTGLVRQFCEEAFERPFEKVFPKFFATKISPDITPTAYCRSEGYTYEITTGE